MRASTALERIEQTGDRLASVDVEVRLRRSVKGAGPAVASAAQAVAPGWRGRLELHYRRVMVAGAPRTVATDRHEGPLRVLRPLYPEGWATCHHVLVHPPGGVVGGDELHLDVRVDAGAHALLTTPGATRFYRSDGPVALQSALLTVAAGGRLEWLPLEAIAHAGCDVDNRVVARLEPDAEMIGWDVLALGLTAAGQPFDSGCYRQHLEVSGTWLDRARIDAADRLLLDGGPGWAGRRVLGTAWFAAGGNTLAAARRTALVDAARDVVDAHPLATTAGVTAPQPLVVVVRVLAHGVEPALALLGEVRAAWRTLAWGLPPTEPRIWRT